MLITTPDYYDDFECIAGECEDSCCAGWQVDVDDRSYAYYESVTGEFGDRLHAVMIPPKKKAEGQFRICEDGRCPFLNKDNLCDLYIALGKDALCETCEQYPRYTTDYGNYRETGIALSCITAGKLILQKNDNPSYVEREDSEIYFSLNNIDAGVYLAMKAARNKAYEIIRSTEVSINDKMILLLNMAVQLQKCIKKPEHVREIVSNFEIKSCAKSDTHPFDEIDSYQKFWKYYFKQAIIKHEWPQFYYDLDSNFYNSNYASLSTEFDVAFKEFEYEYERILEYFVYRYFMKCVFDYDILTKIKMAVVSTLMIRQTYMAAWYRNNKKMDYYLSVVTAHYYSREVEHSEENFAALCHIFNKRKEFIVDKLIALCTIH